MGSVLKLVLKLLAGIVLVGVGVLGLVLPVLPGVVFLLAGLYVLMKTMKKTFSSEKKGSVE